MKPKTSHQNHFFLFTLRNFHLSTQSSEDFKINMKISLAFSFLQNRKGVYPVNSARLKKQIQVRE